MLGLGDDSARRSPNGVRLGMLLGLLTVLLFAATTLFYLQPDLESRFEYLYAVGEQQPVPAPPAPPMPAEHEPAPVDIHDEPAPVDTHDEPAEPQEPQDPPPTEQTPPTPPPPGYPKGQHRNLASLSTTTGDYSPIAFHGEKAYNPNLIPHPTLPDHWILMAQKVPFLVEHVEISCVATLLNGVMVCAQEAIELPIEWSSEGHCTGNMEIFNNLAGPRDGRLAFGPDVPYAIYGGLSQYACLGMWVHDFTRLSVDYNATAPPVVSSAPTAHWFQSPVELDRPNRQGQVDKNFFLFWDPAGNVYAHIDLWPQRTYAQIDAQGHASDNLAPAAAAHDAACMAAHFPRVLDAADSTWDGESIHQATNALALTLCRRADPGCTPSPANTFNAHIFHKKNTRHLHTSYEPFLVLFAQTAPFALHAVATSPYWIQGRKRAADMPNTETGTPANEPEMVYVTSMSWKNVSRTYQGFLDDRIFLAFGIEDGASGLVEVEAASLVQDLAFC